jgi:hypothetical protein
MGRGDDEETRRRGDEETRRRGDEETRRREDEKTRRRSTTTRQAKITHHSPSFFHRFTSPGDTIETTSPAKRDALPLPLVSGDGGYSCTMAKSPVESRALVQRASLRLAEGGYERKHQHEWTAVKQAPSQIQVPDPSPSPSHSPFMQCQRHRQRQQHRPAQTYPTPTRRTRRHLLTERDIRILIARDDPLTATHP